MNTEQLISKYLDGELPPELEAEMHYRLSLSPEARKLFREHMVLWGAARDRGLLVEPTQAMRSTLFNRLASEGMNRATAGEAVGGLEPAVRASELASEVPSGAAANALSGWIKWGIPVVCAVASLVAFWTYASRSDDAGSSTPARATRPAAQSSVSGITAPSATHFGSGSEARTSASGSQISSDQAASLRPYASHGDAALPMSIAPEMRAALREPAQAFSSRRGTRTELRTDLHSSERRGSLQASNSPVLPVLDTVTHRLRTKSSNPSSPDPSETSSPTSHATLHIVADSTIGGGVASDRSADHSVEQAPPAGSDKAISSQSVDSLNLALRQTRELTSNLESTPTYLTPVVSIQGSFFTQNRSLPGPDYTVGLGVEFPGGEHQLYALFGSSGYRLSNSTVLFDASGATLPQTVPSSETVKRDLWYGIGYRYSLVLAEGMKVGGMVQGGIGGRYFRVGAQLPVSYELNDLMRIELAPALQYLSAVGETTTTTSTKIGSNHQDVTERLEAAHQVRVGLGLGVSFLFR